MEGNVLKDLKEEISNFDNPATVIRFKTENPLPENIIERLVLRRINEIDKIIKAKIK
jgi:uncharacterized protein YdhG (YjbR/CyaY superfamily)